MSCPNCTILQSELDRIREQARIDIENLQTDAIILRRQLAKLKGELTKLNDHATPPCDVDKLLQHWKVRCSKNGRTDIARGGKRFKLAQAAIKRWGIDRCVEAIDGLAAFPYAGPQGRSATEVPGSKRFDDVEHALGDEVRFERCENLAKLALLTPDEKRTLAFVEQRDNAATRPPAAKVKRSGGPWDPKTWNPGVRPIDTVLEALERAGSGWKPAGPGRWMAQCPAHEDRTPSLSISEGNGIQAEDGVVGLHCWAGCHTDDVLAAVGLGYAELFPARRVAA